MYREIRNSNGDMVGIIRTTDGAFIIPSEPANYAEYLSWLEQGNVPEPDPYFSISVVVRNCVARIQEHMDSVARQYGYDDIATAVTYAEEPAVPKFQAEGKAFRAWRSITWSMAYAYMAEVEAGTKPLCTPEEAVAMVPPLELPA